MVDNMREVQDIMDMITDSANNSKETTTAMLSKYEETARNVVNISAGGFAFACRGDEFAEAVGETVHLKIENFPLAHGKTLPGVIIRSSNNAGTYIVGCRMLQDNPEIEEYVKLKM